MTCTGADSAPVVESVSITVSARDVVETEVTPAPHRGQTPGVRTAKNRSLQPAQYNVPSDFFGVKSPNERSEEERESAIKHPLPIDKKTAHAVHFFTSLVRREV